MRSFVEFNLLKSRIKLSGGSRWLLQQLTTIFIFQNENFNFNGLNISHTDKIFCVFILAYAYKDRPEWKLYFINMFLNSPLQRNI